MTDSWETAESAFDVAAALLEDRPGLDQMQLHKLLYLVQAANLAWFDTPAFNEEIEAWRWGPVIRGVAGHYMQFENEPIQTPVSGDSSALSERTRRVVERIAERYGDMSGLDLARCTKRSGSPWRQVRGDLPARAYSREEIPVEIISEYHRLHGVVPEESTAESVELAERFFSGDENALVDLMELATGVRPSIH